jgi:hypothetical protein
MKSSLFVDIMPPSPGLRFCLLLASLWFLAWLMFRPWRWWWYVPLKRQLALNKLTYLRSWALLEEPLIGQPLKNFPARYGTLRFNTVFTRVFHWSLSWAISVQSTPSHHISLRSFWILSTHLCLGLPSGSFLSNQYPICLSKKSVQVRGFLFTFVTGLFFTVMSC